MGSAESAMLLGRAALGELQGQGLAARRAERRWAEEAWRMEAEAQRQTLEEAQCGAAITELCRLEEHIGEQMYTEEWLARSAVAATKQLGSRLAARRS